ncbi:hypothetical protein ACFQWH_26875 [Mycolicibacterium sp. GCM10028919]|uniref:Rv2629 family ribosome hibernation factor n=1 Tax=Mycolicibacterium sp. GCM10028919 TaxID=3273401 RepID=UPI00360744AE
MQSDRFRTLLTHPGPFATAYFDDSHDTEDADVRLDIRWRDIAEQLGERGATTEMIDSMRSALEGRRPAVGRRGRCLIAAGDGVVIDENVAHVPETLVVRVSELPYLVPLVDHGSESPTYVVVAVDHAGADVDVRTPKGVRHRSIDGGSRPVHTASSAETPGYGDPQRQSMEAGRQNMRTVMGELTAMVDDLGPAVVFVVGEVSSRSDFTTMAPKRVADLFVELSVGARGSIDESALNAEIDAHLEHRRNDAAKRAAEQVVAELGRGSGLATDGLPGVCAALREGAVETLIVGDVGDATVVYGDEVTSVAPNADVLSELGASPDHVARADEALPLAAIATDAAVMRADERLAPRDGVAAVLRYAPQSLRR